MTSLPLGFGCSRIADHGSPRDARDILENAYALGIRHFDVARSYGRGNAERILGEFARGRRSDLYIVTKCGLNPVSSSPHVNYSHLLARTASPGLYQRIRGLARKYLKAPYSPGAVRRSLELSLQELDTDYVDCLLLHEANLEDANNDRLIAELTRLQREGMIRSFGVGSAFSKLATAPRDLSRAFTVVQYEHSPLNPAGLACGIQQQRTVFTHSAMQCAGMFRTLLLQKPDTLRSLVLQVGVHTGGISAMGGLLLAYSHACNQSGRVLFSTTSETHLTDNVAVFRLYLSLDPDRRSQVLKLVESVFASDHSETALR